MCSMTQGDWDVQGAFRNELMTDENILWTGRPDMSVVFSISDLPQMLFGLVFTAFSIFWMAAASGMLFGPSGNKSLEHPGPFMFFPLFGLPFVLIGLGLLIGPFTYKRWVKMHTLYGVTNKRVLVLTDKPTRKLQAMFLKDIPSIDKSVRANGIGTINFGNITTFGPSSNMNTCNSYNRIQMYPIFYDVAGADSVYGIVNSAKSKALNSSGD